LFGFHGKEGWRGAGTSDLPWYDGKPGDVIAIEREYEEVC